MVFRTRRPGPRLATLVESFTLVVDECYPYDREELLPDGAIDLLINLGPDPHFAILPCETRQRTYRRAWLSGMRRRPIVIGRAAHGYNLLCIRFRAGAASAFFDFDLSEVTDRVVELDDVWPKRRVEEFVDRIAERRCPDDTFLELESLLIEHQRRQDVPAVVRGALSVLESADEGIAVSKLASCIGTSHVRLIQAFERHVGVKPKLMQRLLRFQRAIALEDSRPNLNWTTIAHRCGYYDQAHLIREFQIFAARSPGAYRATRAEYPNYIPVL